MSELEREYQMKYEIICSDNIAVMQKIRANSVHNVITDGPWGINFLSKEWDNFATAAIAEKSKDHKPTDNKKQTARPACMHAGQYTNTRKANIAFQEFSRLWATEAYRILYPGGFILSMIGTRTYHAMVSGIEEAKFEIRDTISHTFSSGFPKSAKITPAIDKMMGKESKVVGTQKHSNKGMPQDERTAVGAGSFGRENEAPITAPTSDEAKEWSGWATPMLKPAQIFVVVAQKPIEGTYAQNLLKYRVGCFNIDATRVAGNRFPANFTVDEAVATEMDAQSGISKPGKARTMNKNIKNIYHGNNVSPNYIQIPSDEGGGASRFYFVSKASKREKEAGLYNFEAKALKDTEGSRTYNARCKNCGKKFIGSPNTICSCDNPETDESVFKKKNDHPTVQSIEFFKYIIQLVCAKGTVLLDPFVGSGTTACAAADLPHLDLNFIGIEKDKHYCDLTEARIKWWVNNQPPDMFRDDFKVSD